MHRKCYGLSNNKWTFHVWQRAPSEMCLVISSGYSALQGLPNPLAQSGQGCHSYMLLGPAISKAEHICPRAAQANKCPYTMYTCMCSATQTSTDTCSAHTSTLSTDSHFPLPSCWPGYSHTPPFWSLPFPTFGASPKNPTISLMSSQKVLPCIPQWAPFP